MKINNVQAVYLTGPTCTQNLPVWSPRANYNYQNNKDYFIRSQLNNPAQAVNFQGGFRDIAGIGRKVFFGKEIQCPFGQEYAYCCFWKLLPQISPKYREMVFDKELLRSIKPLDYCRQVGEHLPAEVKTILDPFCGGAGASIGLAQAGKRVIASDIDANHVNISKYHAQLHGVEDAVSFKVNDVYKAIEENQADCVYLDPPWGGDNRNRDPIFSLKNLGSQEEFGFPLIKKALEKFDHVLLSVPVNIDHNELKSFGRDYEIYPKEFYGKDRIITVHFFPKKNA